MCYIFVKTEEQKLPTDYVLAARSLGNRDGAGVMYVEDDRVKIDKSMAPLEKDVVELFERHQDRPVIAFHLRNQSIGPRNEENVHPYWVTNKEWGDKEDIAIMHNGSILNIQVDRDLSDTANLAFYHLRPLLSKRPSLFKSPEFWHLVSALIGNNKLVLMNSKAEVVIVNPGLGRLLANGIWVSNKAILRPWKSTEPDVTPLMLAAPSPNRAALSPEQVEWKREGDEKNHLRILAPIPPATLISEGAVQ